MGSKQQEESDDVRRLGALVIKCWRGLRILCSILAIATIAPAQKAPPFKTLVSFDGTNGSGPAAAPVQGLDGNLYGTSFGGGSGNCGAGCGTVFKITPEGALTTLHNFDGTDGSGPGALVQATSGNLYGTTQSGGANDNGTVFKITPKGTLTTLHNFDGTDGFSPSGLVQAANGNFYGTTGFGGAYGYGTVYKIAPEGTLTTLLSFEGADGAGPSGLVQATDGNFYGTTSEGGDLSCTLNPGYGCGTVFKMTPAGKLTTLYNFDGTDGFSPSGLVQAANGNFYGSTYAGGDLLPACVTVGPPVGCGTVFEITTAGKLATVHSFDFIDGALPFGRLVQATNGNFYGTNSIGGANCAPYGCGTVFEIATGGKLNTLHSFDQADGAVPEAGLVQATNGAFYGTTYVGGASFDGTVFSLSVGLGPFVETLLTLGKVGTPVLILGNILTGATSVTFNGTPAAFTVKSGTVISTTVPSGATTGPVQVVTPSVTLTSNVSFQVLP
jgi:uncharacterized repeat protein (TIGR03803 family)